MLTATTIFFSFKNFSEYLGNRILENQDSLVNILKNEYTKNSGWKSLKNDRKKWFEIVESVKPIEEEKNGRPDMAPVPERAIHPPPPGMASDNHDFNGYMDRVRQNPVHNLKKRFPEKFMHWEKTGRLDFIIQQMQNKRNRHRIHPLAGHLSLFDENRQPVAGPAFSTENHMLRAIEINGDAVGWLGIRANRIPSHPLDSQYLRQQSLVLLFTGMGVLLLSGLISYMLSRHLLKPVRELAEAAKALTSRNFETRINVKSGDELGELAENFNTLASTLKRYETVRRQWLSDISHELRTPVAILRGEIEAIQDGVREFTCETADSLHSEIMRIGRLINDLHDLSSAESGALKIIMKPVYPLKILKDILGTFRTRLDDHQVTVSDMTAENINVRIMGDPDRLSQVFSNLLENSLRYTFSPGKLLIDSKINGLFLVICFSDSAPGVPPESLPRLFERLYRVDESRSRANGGSGIGLSICKNIIGIHAGTITASDSSAGGLEIKISLPVILNQ